MIQPTSFHNWLVKFCCFLWLALGAVAFLSCSEDDQTSVVWKPGMPMVKGKFKVAVIYVSDPQHETVGYSFAHAQGIEAMRQALGLRRDQIISKFNIFDDNLSLVENTIRDCIVDGAQLIIATSFAYMDTCQKLATEFPNVIFAHCSGYKFNHTNFTHYFGRIYQTRYLSGVVAGLKTKTNKIGYVAAAGKDSSEVAGGINAFAIGVEKVNPQAKVLVRVTYGWFDPLEESNAAHYLIKQGCDVIAQHCDTANPQIEAENARVFGIGYNSDMRANAPAAVLTSVLWHWGAYYTALGKSVIDGTFTTKPYFGGLKEGMISLSPFNTHLVSTEISDQVEIERQRIINGSFNVFDGTLETNDKQTIGETGATLADNEIMTGIHWYYRNIVETNP